MILKYVKQIECAVNSEFNGTFEQTLSSYPVCPAKYLDSFVTLFNGMSNSDLLMEISNNIIFLYL